jgi:hypothetical protein
MIQVDKEIFVDWKVLAKSIRDVRPLVLLGKLLFSRDSARSVPWFYIVRIVVGQETMQKSSGTPNKKSAFTPERRADAI